MELDEVVSMEAGTSMMSAQTDKTKKEKKKTDGKEILWTDDLSKNFIDLRSKRTEKFNSGKKAHRTLYMDIGAELGVDLTPEQLRKKWNNLCRKYKEIKNPPTGSGKPVEWSLYDDMDKVLGDRHTIVPPLLISSSGGTVAQPVSLGSSQGGTGSPTAKKPKMNVTSLIHENLSKMTENDEKLIEQQEKMLAALDKLINLLDKQN